MIVADTIEDDSIAQWVLDRLPDLSVRADRGADGRRFYSAIGWADPAGILLAGVIYDDLRLPNVDMHVAAVPGSPWLRSEFVREAFRYPFEQLGCSRVTGKTPALNKASRRLQELLGFRLEGIVREASLTGEDLCIYGLLRRECRWLEARDGVKQRRRQQRTGTG
jgi:hypothetical protein